MRVLTERDMRRMEAACRKVERMTAIQQSRRQSVSAGSGGDGGDKIPTGRLTLTTTSTWDSGTETQHVYLDRDTHENKILFYAPVTELHFHLPSNPTIGDTYRIVFGGTEDVYVKMQNDNHVIVGPFESLWFSSDHEEFRIVHAYWFNEGMGPGSAFYYQKERLSFRGINTSIAMLQWFVLTYTGKERQVPVDFIDTDGNGLYWNPSWYTPPTAIHPLVYNTCTEWMVRQAHGFCRIFVDSVNDTSETPF